jgi:hypothetical protein
MDGALSEDPISLALAKQKKRNGSMAAQPNQKENLLPRRQEILSLTMRSYISEAYEDINLFVLTSE